MHDRDLTGDDVAKRRTPGTDPQEAITCPVSVTPSRKMESLDAGLCAALEDAGCPVGASIRDRLAFETLLTELSSRFVNIPANRVDSQIEWGMRLVVEQLGIDRCGFGEVLGDGKQFVVTHSYQLPTVPSCFGLILQEQFPAYARMIRQGMIIRLPEDLPADAVTERQYLLQSGLRSSLTIPLTVMGSVVGALGLASFRTQLAWPDELVKRLRLVGDIFTNALARKRADEALCAKELSLRQSQEGLRQLTARLLQAQEQERRRIAREMHDDWTQRLASLGIEAAKLERHLGTQEVALPLLHAMQQQLVALSEDVHALSRQLHPSILDDLGLVEALRSECAAFARREEIEVDYCPGVLPETVPADVALCLYRVAQEALRNVAKHAAAAEVIVTLDVVESEVVMRIEDFGIGFDRENERSQPGLGLSSMAERVALIEGQFSVTTAVGRGTSVDVHAPLKGCPR
ncbi:Oxygen sensor histidine kinase NreB [Anatilimnocola aggregata]|uniref:Oxygen sensor histidine kinase NreB n=1 Tax=Anatilimnocola aggregata TaxID=2528021 RepID=A0A517YFH8_9BACT|nr:GAF domain-containing sensor histidine kinase [Anatilimnocola aggregata]QDU28986.1 Oxygen sensor histidine kinase NreB [Anatilimnocola aggregata]